MKKILIIISFFLVLSANNLFAQSKGNCAVFLCKDATENEDGNTDIEGLFTGFNSNAVGTTNSFKVYTRFQDFVLNVTHTYKLKLINPVGVSILDTDKGAFILASKTSAQIYQGNWEVTFPTKGVYQIQVFVDDVMVEYLNLKVGD